MARSFIKDPDATLDYQFNWAEWLGTDTIATHTVTATSGLTVASTAATSTAVTAWLTGGSAGVTYAATCHITTVGGRTDDRTISIEVQPR